ncbi:MAG TPA: protein-L-isoaspartate(D-aspartate) O-methyltransferase [Polyangiaceae bacterium]|jgi:protein-L-isoaspartate(D-aspartate) O-methyltransferase
MELGTVMTEGNERERLVERIVATTHIHDARILNAFRTVPRHLFVPEALHDAAYEDRALPLAEDQTISQPSMIALMLEELQCGPEQRALEVGAGSGYAAALLAQLVREVDAIELRPALAERARLTLKRAGIANVRLHVGDGSAGLPERAPFDAILVSAGAERVPESLLGELAPNGRITIPVGDEHAQKLRTGFKRPAGSLEWRESIPCIFVPLVTPSRPCAS